LEKQLEEKETLLKSQQEILLSSRSNIESNFDGAKELSELRREINALTNSFQKYTSS
jgi:hypothetical protein